MIPDSSFLPRWATWLLVKVIFRVPTIQRIEIHHVDGERTVWLERCSKAEAERWKKAQALERSLSLPFPMDPDQRG